MNYAGRFVTLYMRQGSRPPKKKKCKKAKWLSEKALQIAMKSKGEKERYTYLNEEFQIIARRDKKVFLSDECKEIEENNIMGKTRDFFKKIRDAKGILHAKMNTIKDRNGMELTVSQFSHSVMCDSLQSMNCSMPGLSVHHQLPEFTETHVH